MTNHEARRDEVIFEAARVCPDEASRKACLDSLCGSDPGLRERIEGLLRAEREAERFFGMDPVRLAHGTSPDAVPEPAGEPGDRPGLKIGPYTLREKLGEGGCGVVYVADQESPVRRQVALKLIKPGMDSKVVLARFTAERQALARMDHAHIAHIHDAGTTDAGHPYFVMEMIRGSRITTHCDQARLGTRERIGLFIQVCQAVQHAHQKGIIHRDLKPSNILVALQDGTPVPKVIDFGIAKATEGRLTDLTLQTELHQFLGTPAYMSPEQAEQRESDVDTRSDIYSLGVLLYELLTGRTPFDTAALLKRGLEEIRRTIREVEPPRPSTRLGTLSRSDQDAVADARGLETSRLRAELAGDLDWIVMKCLEKDRTRRYETANGLAMDLKRYLASEPVTARPPGTIYKIRKLARRNRLAFAFGAAITAVLLVGLAVSASQAFRATRAERVQTRLRVEAQEARQLAEAAGAQARAREAESRRLLYIANLNLAQQRWESGDLPRLRQLLAETRNDPLKGFEWFFLNRMAHLEQKAVRPDPGPVNCTAVSPDGRWCAVGSQHGDFRICDLKSGAQQPVRKRREAPLMFLVFSPDSRRILSVDEFQQCVLWNVASGTRELEFNTQNSARVAAFFPDGRRVLTGEFQGLLEVWDTGTGRRIQQLKGHSNWVFGIAFSPDGRQFATASWDQTVKLWDAEDGTLLDTLVGHHAGVATVAYSPDGRLLASGGLDNTVLIWDTATRRRRLALSGHTDWLRAVCFLPDSRRLASAGSDRTVRIWDCREGREMLTIRGHAGEIDTLRSVPGTDADLATGSKDGTVKLWKLDDAIAVPTFGREANESGYADWETSLAVSPDGRRVIIAKQSVPPEVWEVASRRRIARFTGHEPAYVSSVSFSPEGERVVSGSHDRTARIWEAASGRELLTLRGHEHFVSSVAWSADGQFVVTGGLDRVAKVWNATTGQELTTLKGHAGAVRAVAISPDSTTVVTAGEDLTARIWDRATGREVRALRGHTAYISSVAISPDGSRILTGAADGSARVWNAGTGEQVLHLDSSFPIVRSVDFSADGNRFLTAGGDRTAQVRDLVTGREVLVLRGEKSVLMNAAFSRDGRRIVAVARDGACQIWEAATSEQTSAWASGAGATRE